MFHCRPSKKFQHPFKKGRFLHPRSLFPAFYLHLCPLSSWNYPQISMVVYYIFFIGISLSLAVDMRWWREDPFCSINMPKWECIKVTCHERNLESAIGEHSFWNYWLQTQSKHADMDFWLFCSLKYWYLVTFRLLEKSPMSISTCLIWVSKPVRHIAF